MQSAVRQIDSDGMDLKSTEMLFESISTAVAVLDDSLRLVNLNPAGEMLFKTSKRVVLEKPLVELLPRGKNLAHMLERVMHDMHPVTVRGLRLMIAPGETITVDCIVTPLIEGTQPQGLLIELNQIDRLLRLTHEERVRARHAANRAVIRGLAHEIKNPLGGLRGAAQLLERELDRPELHEYTHIIISEADRLRNLVDRIMAPRTPKKLEDINIHEILDHVRQLLLIEHPDLHIKTDYDPSLPDIRADREQLIQAFLNISRNAVQALGEDGQITFRTGIDRQFTMDHTRHRLALRVEIEDNGPGIPADLLENIFYPLVTGRPEGTGLGLAISQDIITSHGGLIECESQPGQTIFVTHLPLEQNRDE
ncbi:MAG: nitrogen regulation protein NR(II) [Acidiferrobacterales bacterium]